MLLADALDVDGQGGFDRAWQHRHPVLGALAVTDHDLVHREVDVLDSQAAAFEQAQSRAVQEERHQPWHAVQPLEDGTTGRYCGRLARTTSSSHGSSAPSTSR